MSLNKFSPCFNFLNNNIKNNLHCHHETEYMVLRNQAKEGGIGNEEERKGRNRETAGRKNTHPKVSMRIICLVTGKAMIRL